MLLFIIFVIIPLIEIALFIQVGDEIGMVKTLLLCVLTAMIGAVLIRHQGLKTLLSARASMERAEMPLHEIFDGICIAVSGALLMTPGFFTDAIGFSLLVPHFRTLLRQSMAKHFDMKGRSQASHSYQQERPDIIDVEYERIDDKDKS